MDFYFLLKSVSLNTPCWPHIETKPTCNWIANTYVHVRNTYFSHFYTYSPHFGFSMRARLKTWVANVLSLSLALCYFLLLWIHRSIYPFISLNIAVCVCVLLTPHAWGWHETHVGASTADGVLYMERRYSSSEQEQRTNVYSYLYSWIYVCSCTHILVDGSLTLSPSVHPSSQSAAALVIEEEVKTIHLFLLLLRLPARSMMSHDTQSRVPGSGEEEEEAKRKKGDEEEGISSLTRWDNSLSSSSSSSLAVWQLGGGGGTRKEW